MSTYFAFFGIGLGANAHPMNHQRCCPAKMFASLLLSASCSLRPRRPGSSAGPSLVSLAPCNGGTPCSCMGPPPADQRGVQRTAGPSFDHTGSMKCPPWPPRPPSNDCCATRAPNRKSLTSCPRGCTRGIARCPPGIPRFQTKFQKPRSLPLSSLGYSAALHLQFPTTVAPHGFRNICGCAPCLRC